MQFDATRRLTALQDQVSRPAPHARPDPNQDWAAVRQQVARLLVQDLDILHQCRVQLHYRIAQQTSTVATLLQQLIEAGEGALYPDVTIRPPPATRAAAEKKVRQEAAQGRISAETVQAYVGQSAATVKSAATGLAVNTRIQMRRGESAATWSATATTLASTWPILRSLFTRATQEATTPDALLRSAALGEIPLPIDLSAPTTGTVLAAASQLALLQGLGRPFHPATRMDTETGFPVSASFQIEGSVVRVYIGATQQDPARFGIRPGDVVYQNGADPATVQSVSSTEFQTTPPVTAPFRVVSAASVASETVRNQVTAITYPSERALAQAWHPTPATDAPRIRDRLSVLAALHASLDTIPAETLRVLSRVGVPAPTPVGPLRAIVAGHAPVAARTTREQTRRIFDLLAAHGYDRAATALLEGRLEEFLLMSATDASMARSLQGEAR